MFLPPITLCVDIIDQRRAYLVTFQGDQAERRALDFITRKQADSNHVVSELHDHPIHQVHALLIRHLYPQCQHGLSLDLCYGPGHYAPDHAFA